MRRRRGGGGWTEIRIDVVLVVDDDDAVVVDVVAAAAAVAAGLVDVVDSKWVRPEGRRRLLALLRFFLKCCFLDTDSNCFSRHCFSWCYHCW